MSGRAGEAGLPGLQGLRRQAGDRRPGRGPVRHPLCRPGDAQGQRPAVFRVRPPQVQRPLLPARGRCPGR
ncbi:MAG: hypothetical protein MZU91_01615 [Desulfosudis oleivorans]|nr:hypothetical protein [Desulfosudis oleivorans]